MFNTENRPTLLRIGHRLCRIGRRLYYTHTHTQILEELALESALESADYSSKSADSNAYSPKIGVWVRAFSLIFGLLLVNQAARTESQLMINTSNGPYLKNYCVYSYINVYMSKGVR